MPSTSDVNMINLQVVAEDQIAIDKANGTYDANRASDAKYYTWHSEFQTIPLGMDGNPEQFAQRLREALPQVNTLRLPFNEHSFNADGSLHEQYERFLNAAAAEGFQILFLYAGGDVQRAGDTATSADDLYDDLAGEIFDGMAEGWSSMLAWLGQNDTVATAVYGLEIANEPESYSVGGDMDAPGNTRFVELYGAHMIELAATLDAAIDANILVGGWRYSARFDELDAGDLNGLTVIDAIRTAVGDDLVWSSHFFPGWLGSANVETSEQLEALLADHYATLDGDAVLVTETNASGSLADNIEASDTPAFLFARTYEWFAANGIGLGWFPGAETGASNFVVIDGNGGLRFLHQSSLAHGMDAYSLDEAPLAHAMAETLQTSLVKGRVRNEKYQPEGQTFDDTDGIAYGFGYGGNDTITGWDTANDLIYGGLGNDVLFGGAKDDHLFGQYGDDRLEGGSGDDHLFGGDGDDWLSSGAGFDQMTGGAGADTFEGGAGRVDIVDFRWDEGDRLAIDGVVLDILGMLSVASFEGDAITLSGASGTITLHNSIATNTAPIIQALFGQDQADAKLLFGTGGNDQIAADDTNADGTGPGVTADAILAGDGDDYVEGSDNDDVLIGGSGADTLLGGGGDDVIVGGGGNDLLVLSGSVDTFDFL